MSDSAPQPRTSESSGSVQNLFPPEQRARTSKKRVVKKKKSKITLFDRLLRFSLRYTYKPSRILASRLPDLRNDLQKSNLYISAEGIISITMLFVMIQSLWSLWE